jgi:hypothetical protein
VAQLFTTKRKHRSERMKRTLKEIQLDYETIKDAEGSYERNMQLVGLMNELERDYDTFKICLSAEGLAEVLANNEAVPLYQEISAARTDED